jgi:hypothetical protein
MLLSVARALRCCQNGCEHEWLTQPSNPHPAAAHERLPETMMCIFRLALTAQDISMLSIPASMHVHGALCQGL